tara:strand:+ start:406 stop:750 length:345 start_codon:yes stop_codon:yes gene_type:complete
MKTDELTGAALDRAVAKAKGITVFISKQGKLMTSNYGDFNPRHGAPWWCPSTNWAQGGRIIEREGISVRKINGKWFGVMDDGRFEEGSTPLIAAMRCYVASKLGDEVEVPKEFV